MERRAPVPLNWGAASMLTVACCLWGDFPDKGWGDEYVRRLKTSVDRHLSAPFRFVCFSDRDAIPGIDVRPLNPPSWCGHLPKSYVYSPDAGLRGRVLLFDLDNVIVGSLNEMAAYDGPFCVRGRLHHMRPRQPDGDMIAFEAGSKTTLMMWEKANAKDVVRQSRDGREREFILWANPKADQWQEICPGQVVSYRLECRGRLPKGARVVSCHGRPRPHEITNPFIVDNWR